jgi:hypothetical protein
MVVLDFFRINTGGGLILMKVLLKELSSTSNLQILIDSRLTNFDTLKKFKTIKISSELDRNLFFLLNRNKITKLFSFGNLPPFIKIKGTVYVYFHQKLYLEAKIVKNKINFYNFYFKIIKIFEKNVNNWIFQTELMDIAFKHKIYPVKIQSKILPFFDNYVKIIKKGKKDKNTFFYPTNTAQHKNNELLIKAFLNFYLLYKVGALYITISKSESININLRKTIDENNIPIYFLGKISNREVYNYYLTSEFVIHPSMYESFGLVLVEAFYFDCKIIAPNLPYVEQVITASLLYDLNTVESITNAIFIATNSELPESSLSIENKLATIVNLIIN